MKEKRIFKSIKESTIEGIGNLRNTHLLLVVYAIIFLTIISVVSLMLVGGSWNVLSFKDIIAHNIYGISATFIANFVIAYIVITRTLKKGLDTRRLASFTATFILVTIITISPIIPCLFHLEQSQETTLLPSIQEGREIGQPTLLLLRVAPFASILLFLLLFYAPFIQYIENERIVDSIRISARKFIGKPFIATTSITVSFLLFIAPVVLVCLPFTLVVSPVIVLGPYTYLPVSLFIVNIGLVIGAILMFSFLTKFYEKELRETPIASILMSE